MKHPAKSEAKPIGAAWLTRRQLLAGTAATALATAFAGKSAASSPGRGSKRNLSSQVKAVRRYMAAAAHLGDGRILMAGGYDRPWNGDKAPMPLNSAVIYDPRTDTWNEASPMKVPRARHAAVTLPDGRVAITGGYGLSPLSSVEIYDPRTDTWSTSQPMIQPRYDHSAVSDAGAIYLLGGSSHTMLGGVEVLPVTA